MPGVLGLLQGCSLMLVLLLCCARDAWEVYTRSVPGHVSMWAPLCLDRCAVLCHAVLCGCAVKKGHVVGELSAEVQRTIADCQVREGRGGEGRGGCYYRTARMCILLAQPATAACASCNGRAHTQLDTRAPVVVAEMQACRIAVQRQCSPAIITCHNS